METTIKLLQSYWGRDKIIRTISYAAMIGAGTAKGETAQKFGTIASEISKARTVLRLFDDLLLIAHTGNYGLGKKERDPVYRILQILNNIADTAFFPLEHIYWLGAQKIIQVLPDPWMVRCIAVWAISLTIGIIKSTRRMVVTRYRIARLVKRRKLESPEKSDPTIKNEIADLRAQQITDMVTALKNAADLMNAVNWLPPGFLWAGKFSIFYTGIFGTISSVLGLYQTVVIASKSKTS